MIEEMATERLRLSLKELCARLSGGTLLVLRAVYFRGEGERGRSKLGDAIEWIVLKVSTYGYYH